jgi:phosphotriesterase-related protein
MKNYILTIAAVLLITLISCAPKSEKIIITVNGPIASSEMGLTLVHEHILVDFIGADSTGYDRWNREEVVERVSPFLTELRDLNVHTIIECTPAYLGRDPLLLKILSTETGINLVTNTGYYGAQDNKFIPADFYNMTARQLAQLWIGEFNNGIEESGIKPGFIKIAVNPDDTLSPEHVKIVTAAALTHNETGLVIASHTGPDQPAFQQIELLKSYGVSPSSFIWVHAQRGTLEGNLRAAREGAWISLDNVNGSKEGGADEMFSIAWYVNRIVSIRDAGFLNRVLISHDAGWYSPGEENGGDFRGFTALFTLLVPALKEKGFTDKDIEQLLILNPAEAYSIEGYL